MEDVGPDPVGLGPLVEGQPAPPPALVAIGQRAIVSAEHRHVIGPGRRRQGPDWTGDRAAKPIPPLCQR